MQTACLVMNHGKKVFDGAPREVFSHYKELEAMGLAAPQVTYLVHDSERHEGFPLMNTITTVEEAREAILCSVAQKRREKERKIYAERYYTRTVLSGRFHCPSSWIPRTKLFGTMVFIASLFIADNIWGYLIATAVSGRCDPADSGARPLYPERLKGYRDPASDQCQL